MVIHVECDARTALIGKRFQEPVTSQAFVTCWSRPSPAYCRFPLPWAVCAAGGELYSSQLPIIVINLAR